MVSDALVSIDQRSYHTPGSVSMARQYPGSTPGAGKSISVMTSRPGKLSLAIPPWVGAMSTSDGYGTDREENCEFCGSTGDKEGDSHATHTHTQSFIHQILVAYNNIIIIIII